MKADEIILQLTNVTKKYSSKGRVVHAIEDVNFQVRSGESVVIQGPSGSGKSTLLLIAAAMLKPTRGEVNLCGSPINSLSMRAASHLRLASVGIILPTLELIPYLSALENVYLANPSAEGQARAKASLQSLGLNERLGHLPGQLSTGEQRRILVARALLNRPKILFCDEPTANLDDGNAELIRNTLKQARDQGVTIVTVTHEDASRFQADNAYEMRLGKLTKLVERLEV